MKRRTFFKKAFFLFSFLLLKPFGSSISTVNAKSESNKSKSSLISKPERSKVISVWSSKATYWNFETYPYINFVDYRIVQEMLNIAVMSLTGERSVRNAWNSIFPSCTKKDIIVLKPNFNDLWKGFRESIVTCPHVINALLSGLINELQVDPGTIYVYDCTRTIPDEYRKRIYYAVNYVEPYGSSLWRKIRYHTLGNYMAAADVNHPIEMKSTIRDKQGAPVQCYVPHIITAADHIINVPVLKSHQFVSHSGALKNHYGTVRFSDGSMNPEYLHPPIIHQSIVDINCDEQFRIKTRLNVMDALFGGLKKKGGLPERWTIYDNGNPNRLIVSRDPVALDSVCFTMIEKELKERKEDILAHDYLHIANDIGIGRHEHPDATGKFEQIDFRETFV
jgi:hypothetical protein